MNLYYKFWAWLHARGAHKKTSPQDWISSMPAELEAVVFVPNGRALFLRSPFAPTNSLEVVAQLYRPDNEDLLEQLRTRFNERSVN